MIPVISILALAFAWLGYETKWLTIRLPIGESLQDYDNRILTAMAEEAAQQAYEEEQRYQAWLDKRYEPVLVYGAGDKNEVDRRDRWAVIEEALAKRRNNEEIYQRGTRCNRW